jgi:hypothetical protein
MCIKIFGKDEPDLPDISGAVIQSHELKTELQNLGLEFGYGAMLDEDGDYYYTNEWGWHEIFKYVYKAHKWPKFKKLKMDCEDFAILMKGLVSQYFGMNCCAICIGDIYNSICHAFTLVWTDSGIRLWEPQWTDGPGKPLIGHERRLFEIQESPYFYNPKWVLI